MERMQRNSTWNPYAFVNCGVVYVTYVRIVIARWPVGTDIYIERVPKEDTHRHHALDTNICWVAEYYVISSVDKYGSNVY